MPELKHTFKTGRMNKDLDERLVPNGEYRDALNIEVATSEDSEVGTVQTTMGNIDLSSSDINVPDSAVCVGKISDEKHDKLYWMVTSTTYRIMDLIDSNQTIPRVVTKDIIAEYDYNTNTINPVIVDLGFIAIGHYGFNTSPVGNKLDIIDDTGIAVGMDAVGYDSTGYPIYSSTVSSITPDVTLSSSIDTFPSHDNPAVNLHFSDIVYLVFTSPGVGTNGVLNFKRDELITGINIIDDMLFWTDNNSEPKKINITRGKAGSVNFDTHTTLMITDPTPSSNTLISKGPLKEEHITVIRKSPETSLSLEMSNSPREGLVTGILDYSNPSGRIAGLYPNTTLANAAAPDPENPFWDYNNGVVKDNCWISFGGPNSQWNQEPYEANGLAAGVPSYQIGDILIITNAITDELEVIRAEVTTPLDASSGGYGLDILAADPSIDSENYIFDVELEQPAPLFEFKFPRFAYRYKYEDGEYSAFSPFTEVAFLPEKFEYLPKKGYNLGMTNNLRKLGIKGFVDDKLLQDDIVSIDILYKESNSPNIYSVKTIKRSDEEWNAINSNGNQASSGVRGYLDIESEMIHAVLPSNQLLRPWDNVPRQALAQEITGNRLVYGNYLQNYNIKKGEENIKIDLEVSVMSNDVGDKFDPESTPLQENIDNTYLYNPSKSVKSLRTYQLGVVFRDKYGRETPVFSSSSDNKNSIYLEKQLAERQNKIRVQMKNNAPDWAESFKFFIKETSNEYYNLAMDRWYDAADDNIWLTFPSSERNKVDEDTFLILKKEKDNSEFVKEEARYKILAISNNAPESVRTKQSSLGRVGDNNHSPLDGFRAPGNTALGMPRSGVNYMYLDEENAIHMGWDKTVVEKGSANLSLQMSLGGRKSDWYKIKSVGKGYGDTSDADSTRWRIDVEKPFGIDMDITHTDSTDVTTIGSTYQSGLRLELRRGIAEDKPEFDGRFFVKIFKDNLIVEKVIKAGLSSTEYVSVDSRAIRYIDAVGSHYSFQQSINPPSHGRAWSNANWMDDPGTPQLSVASGTFRNRIHSTIPGGTFPNYRTDWHDFWGPRNFWFIDRTVGFERRPGESHSGGDHGYPGLSDPDWGDGIDEWGGYFHLTYTNIGSSTKYGGVSWDMYEHKGQSGTGWANHTAEVSFIEKLNTAGTLFRWMEDPDQHIYEVQRTGRKLVMKNFAFKDLTFYPSGHRWTLHDHWFNYSSKNRFTIHVRRLSDKSQPMGAPDGPYNARYRPDNDPALPAWYDSNGVLIIGKGTCADSAGTNLPEFDNDEPGCNKDGGTWSAHADAVTFKAARLADGLACPGLRSDGGEMGGAHKSKKTVSSTSPHDIANHPNHANLEILDPIVDADLQTASHDPAIWETEPKEDIGLDIYHEVGQVYPIELNEKTNELYIPIGSIVTCWRPGTGTIVLGGASKTPPITVASMDDNKITLVDATGAAFGNHSGYLNEHIAPGDHLGFVRLDGGKTTAVAQTPTFASNIYGLERDVHNKVMTLPWFNCYSFGNGVESDRIRDDFNQVTIDNGPKASTTLEEPYLEERRKSGLIYSGIYNSTSGVNNLNQFIAGEKITKDLNPVHGSIQKLHARNTNLITLCEDKCFKILVDKDALFNADGSSQLLATKGVLGQTTPFKGEYGISKNPESFASESFRAYFTDKQRGAVLRLSQDGLTPISEVGMKDYFADNLSKTSKMVGSYDDKKSTYNITLYPQWNNGTSSIIPTTISFSERVKGWSSFKSFIPEQGISLNNDYFTFYEGQLWKHHEETVDRNNFYNNKQFGSILPATLSSESSVTVLFNEEPGSVKSFLTLNYEGSQAKITPFITDPRDKEYYDNIEHFGWYVDTIKTNLQDGNSLEFKSKEDKWFSTIKGMETTLDNLDTKEFSVQGIGKMAQIENNPITPPVVDGCMDPTASNYNPSAQITSPETGCVWDGCTDPTACNYDPKATVDDGSCSGIAGCMDSNACNYMDIATCDDGSCDGIKGCVDPNACNHNPLATCDDGSCLTVYGCMNQFAVNYNPLAVCDDGSCEFCNKLGCTTLASVNYDPEADCNDPNNPCIPCVYGCMTEGASNFNRFATCDDGSCLGVIESWDCINGACIDPLTGNGTYSSESACQSACACVTPTNLSMYLDYQTLTATLNWDAVTNVWGYKVRYKVGSGSWIEDTVQTNSLSIIGVSTSSTYYWQVRSMCNSLGTNNSSWTSQEMFTTPATPGEIQGCTNPLATNYDPSATIDDGSCTLELHTFTFGINSSNELSFETTWVYRPYNFTTYLSFEIKNPEGTIVITRGGVALDSSNSSTLFSGVVPIGEVFDGEWTANWTFSFIWSPFVEINVDPITGTSTVSVVKGCTDPSAINYVEAGSEANITRAANVDDGSCIPTVFGCTYDAAINYYPGANVDDGSCVCMVNGVPTLCTGPTD